MCHAKFPKQRMEAMKWISTLETIKLSTLQEGNGSLNYSLTTSTELTIQDAQISFDRRRQ